MCVHSNRGSIRKGRAFAYSWGYGYCLCQMFQAPVNNTSVRIYWKILFYPSNTNTGAFYGGSTDIDTDAQYPKYSTDILVFPVFCSISISCFKPLNDSCYLRLLVL